MFSKKAIGPVVATALLLVVAVVAVVGFQSWFQNFSSSTFADIEQRGSSSSIDTRVDSVIGGNVYFQNGHDNVTISDIQVDGNSCGISSSSYSSGLQTIGIGNCTNNATSSTPEVTVFTNKGIYSKTIFLKDSTGSSSFSIDCSSLNGGEWITVPGNPTLGTTDFCVMKYEAKNVGGVPTSQAALTPWAPINQTDARDECNALGTGYSLITDAQWVTVARNVENVASNWADGIIGSTVASGGGLKRGIAGIDDSVSYDASHPADRSLDTNTKAMHTLSNGEEIWDLSGNVQEWLNNTFNTNAESSLGQSSSGFYEWTEISGHTNLGPNDPSLNATHGVGRVYADINDANPSGTIHGFLRGGVGTYGASPGANVGIFNLFLQNAPSNTYTHNGFRCAYTS